MVKWVDMAYYMLNYGFKMVKDGVKRCFYWLT